MNKTIAVIIAITILEAIALFKGIDGASLHTVIGLLAGLGGYTVAKTIIKKS